MRFSIAKNTFEATIQCSNISMLSLGRVECSPGAPDVRQNGTNRDISKVVLSSIALDDNVQYPFETLESYMYF